MCLDLAARTSNNETIQVFGGSYAKKQSFALFHSPDHKHCAPHSSLSPAPLRFRHQPGPESGAAASRRTIAASPHEQERPLDPVTFISRPVPTGPHGSQPSYTSVVRMLSSSRLKGKLQLLGG